MRSGCQIALCVAAVVLPAILLSGWAPAWAEPGAGAAGKSAGLAPWAALPAVPQERAEPVVARLLADSSVIVPGRPFRVGVLLEVQAGWHVYWKNPGQAGLATEVRWTAPQGFQAGPLQFPVPDRFDQGGEVIGYGYSDAVMLVSAVRPPDTLQSGASASIVADVSWLACLEQCVPGGARLELTLSVGEAAVPANAELFEKWTRRMPVSAGSPDGPAGATVSGALPPDGDGRFVITLDWHGASTPAEKAPRGGQTPTDVEFFPDAIDELSIRDIERSTRNGRTTIAFKAAVLTGQKLSAEALETVIGYDLASPGEKPGEPRTDRRRGVRIVVPLKPVRSGDSPARVGDFETKPSM